jgi:hypothetical protein
MLKVTSARLVELESSYPGLTETVEYYEALELPSCRACGSSNTAQVSAGLVGRSMAVAAATTKIRLVPNRGNGKYYCNDCDRWFD